MSSKNNQMVLTIDMRYVDSIMETSRSFVIDFKNGGSIHISNCIISIDGDKEIMIVSN